MKYILTGATIAAMVLLSRANVAVPKDLNVVLIVADDLGQIDLGCLGASFYETPKSDQLAHDGMKFTENYPTCTVCSPTRAALLTGKYPARLHITDWIPGEMSDLENARPPVGRTSALCNTDVCKRLVSH
jgi:arylsulfatase A-like enzyme